MAIKFKKSVPDELYVDSFTKKLQKSLTYNGPDSFNTLVEKSTGNIVTRVMGEDDRFNPDEYESVEVVAATTPDVAEFLYNDGPPPERTFDDEVQVDGSVYKKITNPVLRDYYNLRYDMENKTWIWIVITRDPTSMLKIAAERNREFVTRNLDLIKDDAATTKIATDYLKTLDDFVTTGKGSIPSWKMDEFKLADVPMIPQELIVAFNQLP